MLDQFQMGPNLVRGFAPNGIGPRDITPSARMDALGGTKYWGASAELQMPFWFLPKEVGLKGAVYADAGGCGIIRGRRSWAATGEVITPRGVASDHQSRALAPVGIAVRHGNPSGRPSVSA